MFIPLRPTDRKWNPADKAQSRVASWFNDQGNRYFMVRAVGHNMYDFRILVGTTISADRAGVPPKQVVIAARTLGIIFDQEQLELLTNNHSG